MSTYIKINENRYDLYLNNKLIGHTSILRVALEWLL
jgi:hypothetical protein